MAASSYNKRQSLEAIKQLLTKLRDTKLTQITDIVESLICAEEDQSYDTLPEYQGSCEQIQKLHAENERLKRELGERIETNRQLEKMLNGSDSFDDKPRGKRQKRKQLQNENEELKHKLGECEAQIKTLNLKEYQGSDEQVQKLHAENEHLKRKLGDTTEINRKLERMFNEFQSFGDTPRDKRQQQQLQKENDELKHKLKECEAQIKTLNLEVRGQGNSYQEVMTSHKHIIEKLPNENKVLQDAIKNNEQVTSQSLQQNDKLAKEIKKLKKEKESKAKNMDDECQRLQMELKETKTSLSKLMSAQMTDNNPDIADLSDQNRPNKLAEKYDELYNNQWSDAYENLEKIRPHYTDEQKVFFLLSILREARAFCEKEVEAQSESLKNALYTGWTAKPLPDAIRRQMKDIKKAMIPNNKDVIYQRFFEKLPSNISRKTDGMVPYLKECIHVCWIMALSDPPINMGPDLYHGDPIDTTQYKSYTTKGNRVEYQVWPPLFVGESLLTKGVVEAIGDSGRGSSVAQTKDDKGTSPARPLPARPQTAPSGAGGRLNLYDESGNRYNDDLLRGTSASSHMSNVTDAYGTVPQQAKVDVHGAITTRNYTQTTFPPTGVYSYNTDLSRTVHYGRNKSSDYHSTQDYY